MLFKHFQQLKNVYIHHNYSVIIPKKQDNKGIIVCFDHWQRNMTCQDYPIHIDHRSVVLMKQFRCWFFMPVVSIDMNDCIW